MARITLKNLKKAWIAESPAVDGINLELKEGELASILGPSGCGKSTTLLMLAGIYAPTSGEILFDGEIVNDVEARDRNVGIVFQSYALYPNMSVLNNILFPLRFKKLPKNVAEKEARNIAELVMIEDLLERRPSQLSGGQQQRVALARALVKKPNLLLLDEPLSNLDATLRLNMRSEIKRIQKELEVTTILVTHDQIEATTMADRIICMNKGKIIQLGSPEELYKKPVSKFVASFIGSPPMNLFEGQNDDGVIRVGVFNLGMKGTTNKKNLICGLRPENINIAEKGIEGTIYTIEPLGREILYGLKTETGIIWFLESTSNAEYDVGNLVRINFDYQNTLVFDRDTEERLDSVHFYVE